MGRRTSLYSRSGWLQRTSAPGAAAGRRTAHARIKASADTRRPPVLAAVGGVCSGVEAVGAPAVDVELADKGGMATLCELVQS